MAYSSHGGAYSSHGGGSSVQGQTLEMNVVGCYNLSNKEWFTRKDPYVVIEYAGQKFRTRTDTDGGKNPSFNETFKLALIEGLREVNASVWNSNTIERDDYIGSTKIILNKVIETGYDDTQWSLTNSKTMKSSGSLKLILHYAASARTKPGKPEGSTHGHGAPPAPMYGGPPASMYSAYPAASAPAYGPAEYGAYGAYPPQKHAMMPYPPPAGAGYGAPPAPMGSDMRGALEEHKPNPSRDSSSPTHEDGGDNGKDGSNILRDDLRDTIMRNDDLKEKSDLHGSLDHSYEAFKDRLYEDIKRIDCLEEIEIDHVDIMTLFQSEDIVILSFFDEDKDIFEFYFKNREDMASTVGVGLKHGVVILECGEVTIKEIIEEDWNERWRSIGTNSCEKRKLFRMKTVTPSNVYDGLIHLDVELSFKKPLLWELTKYFSLRESIETFVTKAIFVEYAQGVETSSTTSFKNQGQGSILKGTWRFVTWLTSNGSQEIGEEGSTSSQYKEEVMKGSKDTATIVELQLLHEGMELKDEEMKPFPGTIKSNLKLQFINEGGDGEGGKEVRITVGTVSFKLGRDDDGNKLPWYHEELKVMFGLLNKDDRGYGEIKDGSFKSLEMKAGKVNMKISSADAHTIGKESTGKGRISLKFHGSGADAGIEKKWTSQDMGTKVLEKSAEIPCDFTKGGLILESSVDEYKIVCDYYIPKEVPSLGPPSAHFIDQDVVFQGTWLPKGDGGTSLHRPPVEYTLQATRALRYKDKSYQQKYKKTILVNHSMTHLDGKTYRLREQKMDSKSILREIGSGSEPGWSEPLVEIKDIPNEVPDATIQNGDQQQTNRLSVHIPSTRRRTIPQRVMGVFSTGSVNSRGETLTPDSQADSQPEVNITPNLTRGGSMRW